MPSLRFGPSIRITGWTRKTPEPPLDPVAAPGLQGGAGPPGGDDGHSDQRSARALEAVARNHGGASGFAGPARQDRQPDRRQHAGRRLLVLRAARRRCAGAVRQPRPQARSGAHDDAAPGRGPRRPHRRAGRAAQPRQCAARIRPSPIVRKPAKMPFIAFLGVPVLRAGQTLGVLVVQNREPRGLWRRRDRGDADHGDHPRRNDRHLRFRQR